MANGNNANNANQGNTNNNTNNNNNNNNNNTNSNTNTSNNNTNNTNNATPNTEPTPQELTIPASMASYFEEHSTLLAILFEDLPSGQDLVLRRSDFEALTDAQWKVAVSLLKRAMQYPRKYARLFADLYDISYIADLMETNLENVQFVHQEYAFFNRFEDFDDTTAEEMLDYIDEIRALGLTAEQVFDLTLLVEPNANELVKRNPIFRDQYRRALKLAKEKDIDLTAPWLPFFNQSLEIVYDRRADEELYTESKDDYVWRLESILERNKPPRNVPRETYKRFLVKEGEFALLSERVDKFNKEEGMTVSHPALNVKTERIQPLLNRAGTQNNLKRTSNYLGLKGGKRRLTRRKKQKRKTTRRQK